MVKRRKKSGQSALPPIRKYASHPYIGLIHFLKWRIESPPPPPPPKKNTSQLELTSAAS